jgi:hypothetical protein
MPQTVKQKGLMELNGVVLNKRNGEAPRTSLLRFQPFVEGVREVRVIFE